MRRFGEPILHGQTYTQRPGVYAVIVRGDDVLLTLEDGINLEVQLPGGGIDPGESTAQALHREVFEETGYSIAIGHRLGAYQRYTYMPDYDLWARKVCHIYLCRPGLRKGPPSEAQHSVLWSDRRSAAGILTNSGDVEFLRLAMAQRRRLGRNGTLLR